MSPVYIGIDPGASGGLAFITADGRVVVHKFHDCDPYDALQDAMASGGPCIAYLERVGGYVKPGKDGETGGQPGSAMFNFGDNYGYWRGLLRALQIRTIIVHPQGWQKGIPGVVSLRGPENKAARKRALRDEAGRRFPAIRATLDNCDALLIADYGRRMERGQL